MNPLLIVEMYPAEIFSLGITLVDVCLNWLNWVYFLLILTVGPLIIVIRCMIFLSLLLDVTRMSVNNLVRRTARFENSFFCKILSFDQ